MSTAAEIQQIRALQQQASAAGNSLSFSEAKKQASTPPPVDPNLAAIQAKLDTLTQRLEGMQITGEGFSGQGPRGIQFDPASSRDSGASSLTPVVKAIVIFANGALVEQNILTDGSDPVSV